MDRKGPFVMSLACVLILALMAPTFALAKGPGGGGGGGGHEPGATNNLSVPLINIGGSWTGVVCTDGVDFVDPTGQDVHTGYDAAAGYYYVQGLNTWQAECVNAASASADAFWGDNLSGDAKLKVGMPIRVEIGLETDLLAGETMPGFVVTKLENTLDRLSAYGTFACNDPDTEDCSATVTAFSKVRVFDSGAMWSLMKDGAYVIDPEPIGSEINATGKAVYGYNLRVDAEGTYTITFSFPNVLLTSGSHGTVPVCAEDELGAAVAPCSVSLDINVIKAGGGGGGGKPH